MDKKREEAFKLGMTTYDADKPCKAGHWPCKRYVSIGSCTKCQAMYKKSYSHDMLKVQVPKDVLPAVRDMLKAFGCIVHGQDAPAPTVLAPQQPEQRVQSPLQHLIDALPPEHRAALPRPELREHPPLPPLPAHLLPRG